MNIDEVLKNPAFAELEPERAEAFRRLANNLEGKNQAEAMAAIVAFSRSMPKGREFTKEEQMVMVAAFLDSLPDDERQRYAPVLKMLGLA